MIKKRTVLSLVLALVLGLTGCSGMEEQIADRMNLTGIWVDSDLSGIIEEETQIQLQGDFAAAANRDWKLEMGDRVAGPLQEISDRAYKNMEAAVTDAAIEGPEAEQLRVYYALAADWDDRNEDGIAPLKPYIEDIEGISDLEGLYAFLADPQRNPLFLAPAATELDAVVHAQTQEDSYTVYVGIPALSLGADDVYFDLGAGANYEIYKQVCRKAAYMLGRLGYTEGEARDLTSKCMAYEKMLAQADPFAGIVDLGDVTFARQEAVASAGDYPLDQILDGWGFTDTPYISIDPVFAARLSDLCSQRRLEEIKAFLIVNYALKSAAFLDREAVDTMESLSEGLMEKAKDYNTGTEASEQTIVIERYIRNTPMVGALNRVYVENYFDEECMDELYGMTEDLIAAYREVFAEEEWLSEEGKKACIEKLDAMKIHIAYQDFDSVDYGKLDLKSHAEGGSLLQAYYKARIFEMEHAGDLSVRPYDSAYWDPLTQSMSTTIINACYMMDSNGIYIFAGICLEPAYSKELSYEEKLAGLCTIVGHEMTHGFDQTGAQYDKNGQKNALLSVEDQMMFNDRSEKVQSYYSNLKPFAGSGLYDGTRIKDEATADMGGLKLALRVARSRSGFDYDTFFRSYARLWKVNVPVEVEKMYATGDVHPLSFYRINVGLQQFEEFYDTYGIKEGDGMYLAPDKRICVW